MTLQLTIWDVAHGSAAYIRTPNGKALVFDLGAQSDFSPLCQLKSFGITNIDHLTITHPHLDHIDDILNLQQFYSINSLMIPKHLSEQEIRANNGKTVSHDFEKKLQAYLYLKNTFTSPVKPEHTIANPNNFANVSVKHFQPRKCPTTNMNDHSIVTVVEYAGCKILIPGDNEACSWEELLHDPVFRTAIKGTNVFLASHHGRESGYYRPLFDYFQPQIAIISDGRVSDTSATYRYYGVTKGWDVRARSTNRQQPNRHCLTTRNDGTIVVTITPSYPRPTLGVTIN